MPVFLFLGHDDHAINSAISEELAKPYEDWRDTEVVEQQEIYTIYSDHNDSDLSEAYSDDVDPGIASQGLSVIEANSDLALPGEDIDFRLKVSASTHHYIQGKANAESGKLLFKSRLMPSNEVKLSLKLKQGELEDIELVAYFDLANFTMELDGGDRVLNRAHKKLMDYASLHLRSRFERQYQDHDLPEHAFMLVQMLSYWSVSPEGFVHEKRAIVSQ